MIRAGRFLGAAAAFCVLSLSAFEWELPGRAWTKIDPPGVWSFCSAPRGKSPAEWRTLEQKDVNTLENRLMFSEADGDAWSVPAVRVQKFQLPGEQILELLTGPSSDPAVVYECMAAGELAYEVAVTDRRRFRGRERTAMRCSGSPGSTPPEGRPCLMSSHFAAAPA